KPVGVAWSCSSPLGIAHQESTPVADGQPLPSTLGSATFTATCEDTAGHVTTKSIHYTMETFGQIITDDNPSAYFRLGEAAGDDWVRDSSGNHHDGEAKNATAWEEFGISGDGDSARRFIGDGGYVYVNGIEAPKTALTLGGWVKFDDTGDADVLDHGYDAGLYLHDGHLSFRMLGTTVTDPATVQADRWYFVAGAWNGGTMKLWTASGLPSGTNLASVAASAPQGKRPSGYSTFYIGYGQDEPWLRGVMDEVFYYPSALAAGHLQELWLADPPARAKAAGAPAAAAAGTASAAPDPVTVQSRTTTANTAAKARARAKAQQRARAKQLAKARARAKARAHRRTR
ncbi:MAG: hypothetical protein JWM73_2587, partial [Solirubrobacterales bacterium]|nr:hypothetical protein [Solirubrobacterales bacterium]